MDQELLKQFNFSISIFLDGLLSICQSYYERVKTLESEKYDMEKEVEYKDYKVWSLSLVIPSITLDHSIVTAPTCQPSNPSRIWLHVLNIKTDLHEFETCDREPALFIHYSFLCLDDLVSIIKEFHGRVFKLEGDKWDLERGIKIRLLEVLSTARVGTFWNNKTSFVGTTVTLY